MAIDSISAGKISLVSGKGYLADFLALMESPFAFQAKALFTPNWASTSPDTVRITPSGTHEFSHPHNLVKVGQTGVTLEVSDLSMSESERTTFIGGREYITPYFSNNAAVTITGTSDNEDISISQDELGNTILDVRSNDKSARINLGKIAALTLDAGGGDDKIKINVRNYFGGIDVSGGDGDDEINVRADHALARRVTIRGGAGDDTLAISGKALSVLLQGGDGDDELDARGLAGEPETSRDLEGGEGNDYIYGSSGKDVISGEAGNDTLLGFEGNDIIRGGDGDDLIHGDEGKDTLSGGEGSDTISGGAEADWISGDAGNDILMGDSGADSIYGRDGDDYLYGGGSGNDRLIYGTTGTVETEGGEDYLIGGDGVNTFAPSSTSPGNITPHTGTGYFLADYDPAVDILV